jgi:hypothetical protein
VERHAEQTQLLRRGIVLNLEEAHELGVRAFGNRGRCGGDTRAAFESALSLRDLIGELRITSAVGVRRLPEHLRGQIAVRHAGEAFGLSAGAGATAGGWPVALGRA